MLRAPAYLSVLALHHPDAASAAFEAPVAPNQSLHDVTRRRRTPAFRLPYRQATRSALGMVFEAPATSVQSPCTVARGHFTPTYLSGPRHALDGAHADTARS
ncbi:Protein of unknown function [Gryllus bimaculatus]|nr:Protein of unknown function [Gryllus bimaculatus]